MAYTSPPTAVNGVTAWDATAWNSYLKANLDDHQSRVTTLEAAPGGADSVARTLQWPLKFDADGDDAYYPTQAVRVDGLEQRFGGGTLQFFHYVAQPILDVSSFTTGNWSATDVTRTANTTAAPDGSTTADTLDVTLASGNIRQRMLIAGGGTAANRRFHSVVHLKAVSVNHQASVEIRTPDTAETFSTSKAITTANWQIVEASGQFGAGNTDDEVQIRIYPSEFAAGTDDLYAWKAMVWERINRTTAIQGVPHTTFNMAVGDYLQVVATNIVDARLHGTVAMTYI